ncbi:Ger(x)C family spore germination protein [Bacillus sp. IITD106]|nr:Ger(x)C family spore germination protein [Bacillus sp. IITD106]
MMHRFLLIWVATLTTILSGCWDQRLLKDNSLILAIGYDQVDDKIMATISHPLASAGGPSKSPSPPSGSELLSSIGNTARNAEVRIERKVPEKFDVSKVKVVLLGRELASQGVFSILDSTYRDLRGPLNAKVVIVKENAKDGLSIKAHESMTVSDYYSELLHTSEQGGITQNANVKTICPIILSEGKDFVVPYLTVGQKDKAKVIGLAMFDDDKFSGTLGLKESSMYLILSDNVKKTLPLNFKVGNKYKKNDKNFVSIQVLKIKRKIKIDDTDGNIKAKVKIDVKLSIEEYPEDHLYEKKQINQLNKKIQKHLNKLADSTIKKMQKANSDALGIGQRVKAYHHETWKTMDWKKVYSEVPIEVEINSEIIQHGIIN